MIVVDASVLATALSEDGGQGDRVRARLRGQALAAPELIDIEVASAIRCQHRAGKLSRDRAERAIADLRSRRIRRMSHRALIVRCWQLRDNLACYDAAYVALAEASQATLITADEPLSRAPGIRCEVEVLS